MQLAPVEVAHTARDDMWTARLPLHAQCCGHLLDTSVLSATGADGHFPPVARPIATPCRAVRSNMPTLHTQRGHSTFFSPAVDPSEDSAAVSGAESPEWLGYTLLEQSVRRADAVAFYLARTLVEVLVEHFGTHAHTPPLEGRVLRLYDHLSVGQHFDMSTVNFQLGLSLDDVLPYFRPAQWSLTRKAFLCTPRQRSSVTLPNFPSLCCIRQITSRGRLLRSLLTGRLMAAAAVGRFLSLDGVKAPFVSSAGVLVLLSLIRRQCCT